MKSEKATLNRACQDVEQIANALKEIVKDETGDNKKLYSAFADHLDLVAEALYNLEGVLDNDFIQGCEIEPIKLVLHKGMTT